MTRADFWCRVLGWMQIGGAAVTAFVIYTLWTILFGWIEMRNDSFFTALMWLLILCLSTPPFLTGLLTVLYADRVEQARNGLREKSHVLLRVVLALCGLWSAGVIGFLGTTTPPITFFAVLGLASTAAAVAGPSIVADLLPPQRGSA